MQRGRLEAIWIKRGKRGPMDPVGEAELVAGRGIVGNKNQGGKRQVTLLEAETWEAVMEELGASLDPSTRRANLLVRGLSLPRREGATLEIGGCRLRIRGETAPCRRMEEALPGLEAALVPDWRGGAFAEVLTSGTLAVGDPVEVVADDGPAER